MEIKMQEEVSQKSMAFIVQTGKMTGKVFLQAIEKYLAQERQRKQLNAREKSLHPAYKGRMTIREMMKERSGLSNIQIHDEHIHDFERIARRYGIEYAIKKVRDKTPPHYLIFFRGRDTDILQTAFNEFVKKRLKSRNVLPCARSCRSSNNFTKIEQPGFQSEFKERKSYDDENQIQ